MKIQLIKGSFTQKEAEQLIADLIQVKIKYHEHKITDDDHEETMKMRENRIIKLQNELTKVRNHISKHRDSLVIESEITIS
ncbi:MAG: hypothetical protein ABI388_09610 [Bacteroidia bacterium]